MMRLQLWYLKCCIYQDSSRVPTRTNMQMQVKESFLCSLNGKKAIDKNILLPYHYLQKTPGQKCRSKLALAFNYWLNVPESTFNLITEIVEVLYNSGLLVDDVEDDTKLRRGIPVAHKIYGIAATLTAANYAEHIALEKCLLLDHPQAIEVFTKRLSQIIRGNGADCHWRDNFVCPTEDEYYRAGEMSAGYFMMTVELMQLFSKNTNDFSKLVYAFGQYYQIRNDYLNLCSEKYMRENKYYCEDITEGKFSFPIIHAVNTSPNSKEILDILKQRTKDVQLIKRCLTLIEECGSFQYTKKKLDELLRTCFEEVEKFEGNPLFEKFIADISVEDVNSRSVA